MKFLITSDSKATAWWKRWANELAMIGWSFALCAIFWVLWVYCSTNEDGSGGEAPMMPSNLIRIFWALFKASCFNALAWTFAYAYGKRWERYKHEASSSEYEWKTWAVVFGGLCVCAL